MNAKLQEYKDALLKKGYERVGYIGIVRPLVFRQVHSPDGRYLWYDEVKESTSFPPAYLTAPCNRYERPQMQDAGATVGRGAYALFDSEAECRRAAEDYVGWLNYSIMKNNEKRRALGIPEVPSVKIEDYLLEVSKVRYVQRIEFVKE